MLSVGERLGEPLGEPLREHLDDALAEAQVLMLGVALEQPVSEARGVAVTDKLALVL